MSDALEALLRIRGDEGVEEVGTLLWSGAVAREGLAARAPGPVVAVQPWRALALDLEAVGVTPLTEIPADLEVDHAWVLPERQQQVARAEIARAVRAVRPGGTVWVSAPQREGGRRHVSLLRELLGEAHEDSKHHCRVAWGVRPTHVDEAALDRLTAEDAPREVDGWLTRPGVFAWDRVDEGSALLVSQLPERLTGVLVDLGAGDGWLTAQALARCPGLTEAHVAEGDARALALAVRNLAGASRPVHAHWCDVPRERPARGADVVITNPPFHAGGATDAELGRAFLRQAAACLHAEGEAWVVANRTLPYEATLQERFARVRVVTETGRYKVLHARVPRRGA